MGVRFLLISAQAKKQVQERLVWFWKNISFEGLKVESCLCGQRQKEGASLFVFLI